MWETDRLYILSQIIEYLRFISQPCDHTNFMWNKKKTNKLAFLSVSLPLKNKFHQN